jgi:hypothetical protein
MRISDNFLQNLCVLIHTYEMIQVKLNIYNVGVLSIYLLSIKTEYSINRTINPYLICFQYE